MASRDDFRADTRKRLAARAGHACSNPQCQRSTSGAKRTSKDGFYDTGTAAHITAAAPSGPRYDASLTHEQRRSIENGIWLCAYHGRLVDADEKEFPVSLLREWKRITEERTYLAQLSLNREPDPQYPANADPAVSDQLAVLLPRVRKAARDDLAKFRAASSLPDGSVMLGLRLMQDRAISFTAEGVAKVLATFNEFAITAPPGTGKTTTLLQCAAALLAGDQKVAVFIPLSEWAAQTATMLATVAMRASFSGVSEDDFKLLATNDLLALCLDGWNELDSTAKHRLQKELKGLRRDFPDVALLISTRTQALDVPLVDFPIAEVERLTEAQQMEIATALNSEHGAGMLDAAWRTPGIRDLVAIPLYLTAILSQPADGPLATTKEAVLRAFVDTHERKARESEAFHAATQNFHAETLRRLAASALENETTALSEAEARAVVGRLDKELIDSFQLTSDHLVPAKVLDALTSHHLLVRGLTDPPTFSFHHHQFLEWFASFKVEEAMASAAAGDEAALSKLETSFLDVYAFEESVLFACERMSRRDAKGASDVAVSIRTALGIDPLLAAAMVFRSSVDTWSQVRDDVVGFAKQWHEPGTVDRAVTFMVSTGREEFADSIWALIVSEKDDFHIDVARSGRRLRTSVLGPDREARLRALPDGLKASLLSELVHFGGIEGIELATSVAAADQSVKARASVIEALSFRHARRQLSELLTGASEEVLKLLIDKGFRPADAADIKVPRLGELYAERTAGETNVDLRLHRLVVQAETGAADLDRIAEIVESGDFSSQDMRGGASINEAAALFPSQIKRALLARLSKGLEIPYTAESLLDGNEALVVDGPTAELVLSEGTPLRTANQAARVVGPPVISRLIDRYLTQHAQVMTMVQPRDQVLVDAMYRTQGLICSTDSDAFANAILARPQTVHLVEIVLLCDLVSRHGHETEKNELGLSDENHATLTAEILRWIAVLQADAGTTRTQLATLTGPIARLPSTDFAAPLLDLLARDLTTRRAEREEFLAALAQGRQRNNSPSTTSWGDAYAKALVPIAGQLVVDAMKGYLKDSGYCGFGSEAARVLRAIWDQSSDEPKSRRFSFGPDFSGVRDKRARLANGPTPSVDFVDAILQAVDELLAGAVNEEAATHALDIAATAVLMPYGEQSRRIAQFIELPVPYGAKLRLLSNLTVAGECLSGLKLLELFEAFLEDAKAKPWLLRDNSPQWENWVVLMPFSDQPRVVLDALDKLPKEIINPWQCRGVLQALGNAPADQAEGVLIELSRQDPRFLQEHAWRQAFQDRPTLSAASTLLSLLLGETTGRQLLGGDTWALSRWLASAMRRHDALRADVYNVLAKDIPSGARELLQLAVAEAADNDGVLLLVKLQAASHGVDEHTLHTALERVATRRKPSTEWVGAEEVVGESVQPLRRSLFTLAISDGPEAKAASKALEIIDTLRDESGEAEGERRHPNIETGVPYPVLPVQ